VTLTATDINGNTGTCTTTVTVEDNINPTADCTADFTIPLDDTGVASITADDINVNSNDECGIASTDIDVTSFDCDDIGTPVTVTLTVTDNSGNTATCTTDVTVEDTVVPDVQCVPDFTLQLDDTGNANIVANDIDNGSTDACGISSTVIDLTAFTCGDVGANTVTLTVTDNNGNTDTCITIVTVEDSVDPDAQCAADFTIQLDGAGNASITDADIEDGSTDACGIASTIADVTSFDCNNVGTNTVTLTATDINGNTGTCTTTVTVEDNINPTAICQDITIQLDGTGNSIITANDIDNGSSDECGFSSSLSTNTFDCDDVGTPVAVIMTVTDPSGNTANCTSSVTVEDNVAPVARCQDFTVTLDDTRTASITPNDIENGSTDACGVDFTLSTVNPDTFGCAEVGPNTVTLEVFDENSNSGTCTAVVTVEDNTSPDAQCNDITVQLNAAGVATIVPADVHAPDADQCGIDFLSIDTNRFDCDDIGDNDVVLTVTYLNGFSVMCTSVVTVEDNIAPDAQCQDIDILLDGTTGVVSIVASDVDAGSTDACGIDSISINQDTFDCTLLGANEVTLTVTDVNGNINTCIATVRVSDDVPPIALCQDITVELHGSSPNSVAIITASDVDAGSTIPCGEPGLLLSKDIFTCSDVGENDIYLIVSNNYGDTDICFLTVTVLDDNPVAVCKDITVELDAGGNVVVDAGAVDNGSSDNCAISSYTLSTTTFSCANIGPNSVTLTVDNINDVEATCGAVINVEDNIAPVVNVIRFVDVELDSSGVGQVSASAFDGGSSDACGISNFAVSRTQFSCQDLGNQQVTITVTDNNQNSASLSSNAVVRDSISPVVSCVTNVIPLADVSSDNVLQSSSDNCGALNLNVEVDTGSIQCTSTSQITTVPVRVTDAANNLASCSVSVDTLCGGVPSSATPSRTPVGSASESPAAGSASPTPAPSSTAILPGQSPSSTTSPEAVGSSLTRNIFDSQQNFVGRVTLPQTLLGFSVSAVVSSSNAVSSISAVVDLRLFDRNGDEVFEVNQSVSVCFVPNRDADISSVCLGALGDEGYICQDSCLEASDSSLYCGNVSQFNTAYTLLFNHPSQTSPFLCGFVDDIDSISFDSSSSGASSISSGFSILFLLVVTFISCFYI